MTPLDPAAPAFRPVFAGLEGNVQNVLLEDVESIEAVRGAGGTIWRSNAVNGVINIITNHAKDTGRAVTTTSADQGKQQVTFVYSMSSCRWGKWLLQQSETTEYHLLAPS